jgi:hypothetical protein
LFQGNRRRTARARVTAGLIWAPLMPPATYTPTMTANAHPKVISVQPPTPCQMMLGAEERPEPGRAATAMATTVEEQRAAGPAVQLVGGHPLSQPAVEGRSGCGRRCGSSRCGEWRARHGLRLGRSPGCAREPQLRRGALPWTASNRPWIGWGNRRRSRPAVAYRGHRGRAGEAYEYRPARLSRRDHRMPYRGGRSPRRGDSLP